MAKPTSDKSPAWSFDPTALPIADPQEFTRNMLRLMEESGKVMAGVMERSANSGSPAPGMTGKSQDAAKLMTEVAHHWMADPARLAEAQSELMRGYTELWSSTLDRMMGKEVSPITSPEAGDSRFKDPEWTTNPYFDFWKQAYLLTAEWATKSLDKTANLDERTRQRAEFYLRQMISMMSPSNFMATNPEVIRETINSNGRNLVAGMENLASDLAQSGSILKISQTDTSAFEVGRNLATTPGKVVFQNDLLQLIQYTPSTEKVHEIPFVLVPPWINKFYILDLGPQKSFIKYIVDQGFTVFVVSWVNPDAKLSKKTFEDYMKEGILAATEAAKRECGTKKINILGYCIGGTLLGTTLAYLAGRGEEPYNSATFLVAQVDFAKAGDLKLFIDDAQLKKIETLMNEKGYLEGSRMATVFNMLRPRDLIWPYVVNNYLLGKKPFPFDLLFWNQELDAHAGGKPQFLSARVLSREQAGPRQDADGRRQARPRQDPHSRLPFGDARRPHLAAQVGFYRRQDVRRPG